MKIPTCSCDIMHVNKPTKKKWLHEEEEEEEEEDWR